jgi:hypothetical protein
MLTIMGTIKIDDGERLLHLERNLRSMEPIADLLAWDLNVAGYRADQAKIDIQERWPDAAVTTDDDSFAHPLMRAQLDRLPVDRLAFYWLEDHWYVCEDTPAFRRVLDEFAAGSAQVLTVSHLVCSWEQKRYLPVNMKNELYTVYRADLPGYERAWTEVSGAYAAGIPLVCKKHFAIAMLEHCCPDLACSKKPAGFELPPHKARPFLAAHPFLEMVPDFHVFREVFRRTNNPRAITWDEAEKIIEERQP